MSKVQVLRDFISQTLAVATQDIVAAVDRLVAGYEEEASVLREQIDRQREQLEPQLELLHQPQLHLSVTGKSRCSPHGDQQGELEGGTKEDDPHSGTSDSTELVDLQIFFLENQGTEVLTENVLRKCPMLTLKCPPRLQDSDLQSLIRSTVAQLTGQSQPFDVGGQSSQRLDLKTKNAPSAGGRLSSVFVRPKFQRETEKMEEGSTLKMKVSMSAAPMWPCEDNSPQTSSYLQGEKVQDEDQKEDKEEGCSSNILLLSSTSQEERNVLTQEANDEDLRMLPDKSEEKNQDQDVGDDVSDGKICGEGLKTTEFLKDHLQQCHESQHPSCSTDEDMTVQSDQMLEKCNPKETQEEENHQNEEPKPQEVQKKKMHMCGVCGKSLSDYRSLSRHKMIHSGERPHGCQVCGRSFKLAGTLRQHEKIHMARERSYLCDVCCKMFLTSKQLQIHMRTHTDEKPYACSQCGRGFNTKGTLTIHMRIHTGETPYRCPDCGWAFKRKSNLDNHVTTHSGVKAFICGVCGKACARKTHLNVHMRTHNGERPYKCTLCDKAFTQSHCLKTHMKSHRAAEAVT